MGASDLELRERAQILFGYAVNGSPTGWKTKSVELTIVTLSWLSMKLLDCRRLAHQNSVWEFPYSLMDLALSHAAPLF
jgi:hypothetical protein